MRRLPVLALLLPLAATGACGNERNDVGSLAQRPSAKTRPLHYPQVGLDIELPRNIKVERTKAPGVFRGSLGDGLVSAFAYSRREQIPSDASALRAAKRRLEAAAKKRDSDFRLERSVTTRVAGASAVELLGEQTISRGRLRTRSLHVYKGRAEYVIELLAPRRTFGVLDRAISPTIRRSLRLTGQVRRPSRG
jgi:hypothetical protein